VKTTEKMCDGEEKKQKQKNRKTEKQKNRKTEKQKNRKTEIDLSNHDICRLIEA
jgi:hypothetical protein